MDHECDTTKKSLHEEKPALRRWSNCFGLVNRFRRLKNRLSLVQTNSVQQNTKQTDVYSSHHHHHSATTIATDSRYLSSNETIEHDSRSPTTAYHLSMSNTPTSSLSPPPRHSHHHIGRADYTLYKVPEHYHRECQPLSSSCRLQKMTLRLSLDTVSYNQQQCHHDSDHSLAGSPPDVDSLRIYHGGDSTLHAESSSSAISNRSSLVYDAPRPPPPCRSGTLGQYKTIKDEGTLPPPLPAASISSSSSISSSNLASNDLPLKERRRRRSPLMFADNDKLTLPIPRNDIFEHNNTSVDDIDNKRMMGSLTTCMTRTLTPNSDDYNSIIKSREMAMQQLEGKPHGKVVSMARIAPTKLLDEQLKTNDDEPQQRAPLANQTGSLLTPSAAATLNNKATVIPTFLPTPSSFPPPPHHPSFCLPSTPNSMDSSYL